MANQEIQDLIIIAQFSPIEKIQFMSDVRNKLRASHITLDFLES